MRYTSYIVNIVHRFGLRGIGAPENKKRPKSIKITSKGRCYRVLNPRIPELQVYPINHKKAYKMRNTSYIVNIVHRFGLRGITAPKNGQNQEKLLLKDVTIEF